MVEKFFKNPISMTVFLAVVLALMLYQSYALTVLSLKLKDAKVSFAQSSAVNLSSNGSQPDMVGGC
ncbi:hypothetical protein CO046_03715 [Candidatus Peregrinibacteria bacterium CG_4_9_14_0_2_um_filter_53_11]|nr:MAG: hypothetical protein CO046_03715 [Candidatus Peregrinibacteria bacterium CG_4_9_14_0_2_um_filter_53_11]